MTAIFNEFATVCFRAHKNENETLSLSAAAKDNKDDETPQRHAIKLQSFVETRLP